MRISAFRWVYIHHTLANSSIVAIAESWVYNEDMAVKKMSKAEPEVVEERKELKKENPFWMNLGWTMLLLGGLAHMLPEQMAPLLKWAVYGVNVQMAVGTVSVVVALYFLLGE